MNTARRLEEALAAIDHGHDVMERSSADWQAVAIVLALTAVAEAIDYATGRVS